jgi:hypothetical protein
MCRDAIRRGGATVVCAEPVRFDALAALVPALGPYVGDIERQLPRLDMLSRLSVRWVYVVGFSEKTISWTLFQTDDAALLDAVLAEAECVRTFTLIKRHPRIDRDVRSCQG